MNTLRRSSALRMCPDCALLILFQRGADLPSCSGQQLQLSSAIQRKYLLTFFSFLLNHSIKNVINVKFAWLCMEETQSSKAHFFISPSHEEMGWSSSLPLYTVPSFLPLLVTAFPVFHLSPCELSACARRFVLLSSVFFSWCQLPISWLQFFSCPPSLLVQFCLPTFALHFNAVSLVLCLQNTWFSFVNLKNYLSALIFEGAASSRGCVSTRFCQIFTNVPQQLCACC